VHILEDFGADWKETFKLKVHRILAAAAAAVKENCIRLRHLNFHAISVKAVGNAVLDGCSDGQEQLEHSFEHVQRIRLSDKLAHATDPLPMEPAGQFSPSPSLSQSLFSFSDCVLIFAIP